MVTKKIAQIFAENLATARTHRGLSQYDLAQMTGISRTAISHYEREGIIPPADRLERLADALAIPVHTLFKPCLKTANPATDVTDIDARSVKKLRDILSLSVADRNDLYRILNKMLRKDQLEKQEKRFMPE
ncbi:MAG: helix-turn-helix domain-containing protein [Prevotella sp.]|jgi:transcriptional regulator with XRE-family HTH domain|nr:helix-turn-helix domain-containing protein [Prevotella sp.]